MDDNELLLIDRLGVIRDTITKYGADKFFIAFSGGKDSTVVSHLVDMSLPGNEIPRVFINTGIEYQKIVDFVHEKMAEDSRFIEIKPSRPIKEMLEKSGYPFKSKEHSDKVSRYKNGKRTKAVLKYKNDKTTRFSCPDILQYQYEEDFKLKISMYCCHALKKDPSKRYQKQNGKEITITGMQRTEGGNRVALSCIVTHGGKVTKFHPMAVVTDEWENWFIQKENIQLCELYYEPYNFKRTGCKGCPYALNLQEQLETMARYFPEERKQCEWIWKPVYDEYRRLGYRLKKVENLKLL